MDEDVGIALRILWRDDNYAFISYYLAFSDYFSRNSENYEFEPFCQSEKSLYSYSTHYLVR